MQNPMDLIPIPVARYRDGDPFFHGNSAFDRLFPEPDSPALLRLKQLLATAADRLRAEASETADRPNATASEVEEVERPVGLDAQSPRCLAGVLDHEGQSFLVLVSETSEPSVKQLFLLDDATLKPLLSGMEQPQFPEDQFYKILGSLYDDFTIISKEGVIEKALPNFETMYGISPDEVTGHTIFEMEERHIFNPCVSARVLKSGKKETLTQQAANGRYLTCTSIPIFQEDGELFKVVSYTQDATKYESLKEEYDALQATASLYSQELERLRLEQKDDDQIAGSSPELMRVIQTSTRIAAFDANVLLTGESGVGKSMFASMIHRKSKRANGPFISINCGAIPVNLLESEIFGYEKGAFTGAGRNGKAGLAELADHGTLFLDEVGDLPMHMQVKLLKLIQEKTIIRVGGVREKQIDFRLIAATNQDIKKLIAAGEFREDLYYRLNVIGIHIPPLRERKEDIFSLINHFTQKFNQQYDVSHAFSSRAIDYLESYRWPGNIRELENVVERMMLTAEDYTITEDLLPQYIYSEEAPFPTSVEGKTLKEILSDVEKQVILNCYKQYGTTTKVAEVLGISQPSASIKLSKYRGAGK